MIHVAVQWRASMNTATAAGLVIAVAFSSSVPHGASAKESYRENSVKADTKEAFDQLVANVRKELVPDGRYEYIKPDEKKKIDAALDKMTMLFEQNHSVEA